MQTPDTPSDSEVATPDQFIAAIHLATPDAVNADKPLMPDAAVGEVTVEAARLMTELGAAVTYQYMPMAVRQNLSKAAAMIDRLIIALTTPTPVEEPAKGAVGGLDGNDIWEALFGIMKGNVPDELTEDMLSELAAALSATDTGQANAAASGGEAVRNALRGAIRHIEHMAAWIGKQNAGYSFEALGEDMPGYRAALASPSISEEKVEAAARAISKTVNSWDHDGDQWEGYVDEARAALTASSLSESRP